MASGEARPERQVFYASVTRNARFDAGPREIEPIPREDWATGDFVLGRVTGDRDRLYQCETSSGRLAEMVRGDMMIGALGRHAATLGATGSWREVGADLELDALTEAGLLGRATSLSLQLPESMRLDYLGHVHRGGRKLGMADVMPQVTPRSLERPVVLVVGTSMAAGKTTTARGIIRILRDLGQSVAAVKLTGSARYRDLLSFSDAGARHVFDMVDAGLPSTICLPEVFGPAADHLLAQVAATDADVVVVEAGASPLEPYNGAAAMRSLQSLVCFTILCASDPYAVLGLQQAFGEPFRPDLVAGPAANTLAGIELVRKLSGLEAMNLLDRSRDPVLARRLALALDLDAAA